MSFKFWWKAFQPQYKLLSVNSIVYSWQHVLTGDMKGKRNHINYILITLADKEMNKAKHKILQHFVFLLFFRSFSILIFPISIFAHFCPVGSYICCPLLPTFAHVLFANAQWAPEHCPWCATLCNLHNLWMVKKLNRIAFTSGQSIIIAYLVHHIINAFSTFALIISCNN